MTQNLTLLKKYVIHVLKTNQKGADPLPDPPQGTREIPLAAARLFAPARSCRARRAAASLFYLLRQSPDAMTAARSGSRFIT